MARLRPHGRTEWEKRNEARSCLDACGHHDIACRCGGQCRRDQGDLRRRGAGTDRRHDRRLQQANRPQVQFTTGPTGYLRDVIATGQHADLIIASAPLMGELEKTGKLTAGSRTDLGRVGLGVVIREGATAPDVSTPEALKQLLLKAPSIAYTDPKLGGTSVIHLMKLADRFGITD